MKKKQACAAAFAAAMTFLLTVPASAASWHLGDGANAGRYWYGDAANYLRNGWYWVDGNADGVAERYYFDAQGWLLVNGTAPDGNTANDQGAWVLDGTVQRTWVRPGPAQDIISASYGGPTGEIKRGSNVPPTADGREDLSNYQRAEYYGGSWRKSKYSGKYYINADGYRVCRTLAKVNGETFLFGDGGFLLTGWRNVDGSWMYFYKKNDILGGNEGAAAVNTYVGSYRLNEQGVWDGE